MTATPFVSILMGSDSDWPCMQACADLLKRFDVPFEVRVSSAHRTPHQTHAYVKDADARGCAVFIAAAGMAAHLAGTVAALTTRPVIGVPMDASCMGIDALLSTVQMPGGIPVASMAIGKAGAKNAAFFAMQILGLKNEALNTALQQERDNNAEKIAEKNARLQETL